MQKICLMCKNSFIDNTSNKIKKYCSLKCRYNFNYDKYVESSKKCYLKHKKEYDETNKNYRVNNLDLINKKAREKYASDLDYRLKKHLCTKKWRENELKENSRKKFENWKKNNLNKLLTYCEICGSKKNVNQHHENYNFPYNVIALCKRCHNYRHSTLNNNIVTKCKDLYTKKFIHT